MITFRCAAGAACCIALASAGGCSGTTSTSPSTPTTPVSPGAPTTVAAALQVLSAKAIYFGHQSVGSNIMDGVGAQIAANPGATLRIVNSASAAALSPGVFAHSSNGSNGDPAGKNAAFASTMQSGVGDRADIAFFKYCYVDIDHSSNVAALFADYRARLAALKSAYPRVRIVHVTVPLTVGDSADNSAREQFSGLLRQAYTGSEPLFDLAQIESTRPDGTAESLNGARALVSAYSSDGGHLNATGQEVVAKALLLYLASL